MKLLRIDSSARQSSVSRQLTGAFVKAWKRQCPDGEVVSRDLTDLAIPAISDEWEAAARTDPTNRTPAHRVVLALSDRLVDELEAANVIVIGSPMHDFTVSAHLKAWIDQIVRPGRTVAYGPQGPQGLLTGRRVVVLTSRGGSYSENPLRLKLDFQAPYLQAILAFME